MPTFWPHIISDLDGVTKVCKGWKVIIRYNLISKAICSGCIDFCLQISIYNYVFLKKEKQHSRNLSHFENERCIANFVQKGCCLKKLQFWHLILGRMLALSGPSLSFSYPPFLYNMIGIFDAFLFVLAQRYYNGFKYFMRFLWFHENFPKFP